MFLCYNAPANMSYFGWENEALPLGNGKIGAKVFGGKGCELIQFNEKTLWSGGSDVEGFNFGISDTSKGKNFREVQKALESGNAKQAAILMEKLQGNHVGFGSYQAFGNLYLNFGNDSGENYVRDLDLSSASAMVSFKQNKASHVRHYFVSYPDNVFVGRIACEEKDKTPVPISADAYLDSEQNGTIKSEGDTILLFGTVNDNKGIGAKDGKNKNSMKYGCAVKFITQGGTVSAESNGHVKIENAESILIIMSLATNYKNDYPHYFSDEDPLEKAVEAVNKAAKKTFGELYRTHLADYRALFDRVKFSLGEEESTLPTDYMLSRFGKKGEFRRSLITLLFQYGRYLLIASSRDGSLPANLQGIWNAKNNPPWECDYHLNINLQMNYMPAFTTNLAETALPYIDFINSLKKPGRVAAYNSFGIGECKKDGNVDYTKPTGWVCHTMVSPLGMVAPGYEWRWGWAPANGAWAAFQMGEYFSFTGDTDKLEKDIYPAMEETALLWSQLLIPEKGTDRLIVSPCYSAEHGPVSSGGTFEQSIIYALFDSVIKFAAVLKDSGRERAVNAELIEKLKYQLEKLQPYSKTKRGFIKEWVDEDSFAFRGKLLGVQKQHRHISHLLGLYPFEQITDETPQLQAAASASLDDRGIKTTGWALAHRLLCRARLGEGEKCGEIIAQILKTTILKNLWGTHPPFQIDGNFGFTAGVAEMLLQSHGGVIKILPAIPKDWRNGEFSGLVARGNFVVSAVWKDGRIKEGTIESRLGGKCRLYLDGKVAIIEDENKNELPVKFENGVSEFMTEKGKAYSFC